MGIVSKILTRVLYGHKICLTNRGCSISKRVRVLNEIKGGSLKLNIKTSPPIRDSITSLVGVPLVRIFRHFFRAQALSNRSNNQISLQTAWTMQSAQVLHKSSVSIQIPAVRCSNRSKTLRETLKSSLLRKPKFSSLSGDFGAFTRVSIQLQTDK